MAMLRTTRMARRGLSYMEVMIAAAIGLAGILGAVAMYPVASVALQKGIIADTISTVGPSAQKQVRTLNLNNAQRWMFFSGLSGPGVMTEIERPFIPPTLIRPNPNDNDAARYVLRPDVGQHRWHNMINAAQSFCFDPRLISSNPAPTTNHNPQFFPSALPITPVPTPPTEVRMLRITLANGFTARDRGVSTPATPYAFPTLPMGTQQARTIFKVSDDLLFERPEDSTGFLPARQEVLFDSNGATQRRDYFADFEWIVTATPQIAYDNSLLAVNLPPWRNTGTYDLAVVVFYQRRADLSAILEYDANIDATFAEDERVVNVTFDNGAGTPTNGLNGGDLVIRPRSATRPDTDIALQPDQWVMLSADTHRAVPDPNNPGDPNATVFIPPLDQPGLPIFQWYRVVQTSLAYNDSRLRYVTLEGADWPTAIDPAVPGVVARHPITDQPTFVIGPTQMTICSGVVGVFHDTMQLQ